MAGKFKSFLKSLTLSAALTFAGAQAQAKSTNPSSDPFNATTEMRILNQLRGQQIQRLSADYMKYALKFEKCFLTPYICPAGNITIGIG